MHLSVHAMQMYTHSFRPLVILFAKNQESAESIRMASDAIDVVCKKYFGKILRHSVAIFDHADGIMAGMQREDRPSLRFATCWPHLSCARLCALMCQYAQVCAFYAA